MIVYFIGVLCFAISGWFARDAWQKGCKFWMWLFIANMGWDLGCMIGEALK